MAYVRGYEYDIFVSYASDDDKDEASDAGWVTAFVGRLKKTLGTRLGGQDRFSVYFDRPSLKPNHHIDDEILGAVERSALFLAVTSTTYALREYPRKEFEHFMKSKPDSRRLFAIEYLPLDEDEAFVEPLNQHKRLDFWRRNEVVSATAKPLHPDSDTFRDKVHDLAHAIKKQLKAMQEGSEPTAPKGLIYLAETTDDLDDERDEVQRFLEQKGYAVLPDASFPHEGAAFSAAASKAIERADLYVHLLGRHKGKPRPELQAGYGHAQIGLARASDKPMLLWRQPDTPVNDVKDAEHRKLLSDAAIVASGLKEFMNAVVERIESDKRERERKEKEKLGGNGPDKPDGNGKGPRRKTKGSHIFINHDALDKAIVENAWKEFGSKPSKAAIWLARHQGRPDEVKQDLETNLEICDILVLINAQATIEWVRRHLLRLSKVRGEPWPRRIAIFRGPPQKKEADIDFSMPDLRVEYFDDWSPEKLRRAVADLDS